MTSDGEQATSTRRLILGLGNPGAEYRDTRHNLGFRVVEELAARWRLRLGGEECRSRFVRGERADLAAPQTYMNRSGFAARCLVERFHYAPEEILVVFDDVELPLGRLRLRPGGRPAGHRGLESVIENLRTDRVPRLRLGIAPTAETRAAIADLAEFVLQPFTADEAAAVREQTERAADACESWIDFGSEVTMNRFNG